MSDFSSQINDLIEYKKLIVKMEEALKTKEEENQKILNINSVLTTHKLPKVIRNLLYVIV